MTNANSQFRPTSFVRRRCSHAVIIALGAMTLATQAQAQQSSTQRVEVTGSSIKRIDGETALPVEIMKRDEIDKIGVTTAAELLQKISANVGGLTDGASITDSSRGQRGFNGANLRGLGVSSTLVLLNGRRLANFATPGDSSGVDLNNIPAGAIQRVEVLKDGASAIYGTDAIGGVINFITRTDYQGADLAAHVFETQAGGASKHTLSVSGGYGDLAKDRFNVFAAFDFQQLGSLRSTQRDFIRENDILGRTPFLSSSNAFPANIGISSAQRTALQAAQPTANWTATRINLARDAGCNPPTSFRVPAGIGGVDGCTYNYMADTEIYPESTKQNLIARATFQVANDHQLFVEALSSTTETDYVLSPATQRLRTSRASERVSLPAALQASTGIIGFVDTRLRLQEAGNRTQNVTSDASRFVAGAKGTVGEWEYDAAVNHSVSEVEDRNTDGWVSFSGLVAGIRSGAYNPFVLPTSDAGRRFMDSIKIAGGARTAKSSADSIDGKLTRTIGQLAGGDVGLAIGAEARREKVSFRANDILNANDIVGDRSSSGATYAPTDDSRTAYGVFAEISAPFSKEWEAQFALRHDRYGEVRSTDSSLNTTNPKVGLSWRPNKQWLVRSSASTGFRAPSIAEMYRPQTQGSADSILYDPASDVTDQFFFIRNANPNLKPEKSRQFALGAVFEPAGSWNGSIDYWSIRKTDVISDIGEETIFDFPQYYNNPSIVVRDSFGDVLEVVTTKANRGVLRTSGLDFAANWRGVAGDWGRLSASINATLVLEYKFQSAADAPLRSGLGNFRDDKAVQRWRHRLNIDWEKGALTTSLVNSYLSGYEDQNVPGMAVPGWDNRDVSAYSLWDLTAVYKVSKDLKLRGGVLNLLDTNPPFTNQGRYFMTSFDPTYADPRGRSYFLSMNYKF